MEKKQLLKKLFTQKNKDYTYAIAFFLIFSFFILFVIRPNLLSVFEANNKIDSLRKLNSLYDEQINKIIELQSSLEANRENLFLLNESIASKPEINKVLSDLNTSSQEGNLTTSNIGLSNINLKEKENADQLKSFSVSMGFTGDFQESLAFVKKIFDQRRLKTISDLGIGRNGETASQSGELEITMKILGYFL